LNGVYNALVARAPTNVSSNAASDLKFARLGIPGQQVKGGQNHTRRTVAALQPMILPESLLYWMQFSILSQALDG